MKYYLCADKIINKIKFEFFYLKNKIRSCNISSIHRKLCILSRPKIHSDSPQSTAVKLYYNFCSWRSRCKQACSRSSWISNTSRDRFCRRFRIWLGFPFLCNFGNVCTKHSTIWICLRISLPLKDRRKKDDSIFRIWRSKGNPTFCLFCCISFRSRLFLAPFPSSECNCKFFIGLNRKINWC